MRAAVVIAVSLAAAPAQAGPCATAASDWSVLGGTLADDARCDGVILTADGDGRTEATAQLRGELDGDAVIAFRWQRLSADAGTLQAKFPGGVLIFRDGEIGVYVDEASWQATGFRALPAALAHLTEVDAVDVRITLAGDAVTVSLDGTVALRDTIATRARRGAVIFAVHGQPGARSRLHLVGARVTPSKRPAAPAAPRRAASRTRAASRR